LPDFFEGNAGGFDQALHRDFILQPLDFCFGDARHKTDLL